MAIGAHEALAQSISKRLAAPPFGLKISRSALERDLSPLKLLQTLNDVFAELDNTLAGDVSVETARRVGDMVSLLRVLGLSPPDEEAFGAALGRGDRSIVLPVMHACLKSMQTHKKRIYDARFALPVSVLAEHARPEAGTAARDAWSPVRRACFGRSDADDGEAASASEGGEEGPECRPALFERLLEVGIPETWDTGKLVALTKIDTKETATHPRRTMAQRWKASARRLASKLLKGPATKRPSATPTSGAAAPKAPSARLSAPPKDCLHATEPGAVTPQLLWSYPRRSDDGVEAEIVPFCFPDGVRVRTAPGEGAAGSFQVGDPFVFHLSLPKGEGAAAAATGNTASLLYGVCVAEATTRDLDGGGHAVLPRAACLLTRVPLFDLHAAVLRDALEAARGARDSGSRRHALRAILGRYGAIAAPSPGGAVRFRASEGGVERCGALAAPDTFLRFLGTDSSKARLPPLAPDMDWTIREYEHVAATAEWAVPRLLRRLPIHTLLRALAGMVCEMQIVVISESPGLGAATVSVGKGRCLLTILSREALR